MHITFLIHEHPPRYTNSSIQSSIFFTSVHSLNSLSPHNEIIHISSFSLVSSPWFVRSIRNEPTESVKIGFPQAWTNSFQRINCEACRWWEASSPFPRPGYYHLHVNFSHERTAKQTHERNCNIPATQRDFKSITHWNAPALNAAKKLLRSFDDCYFFIYSSHFGRRSGERCK